MFYRKFLLISMVGLFAMTACCSLTADNSSKSSKIAGADVFPEGFPEELKNMQFLEKESKELAEGVTYYHYHWKNILPDDVVPLKRVWTFSIRFNPSKAEQKSSALETMTKLKKEVSSAKKSGDYYKIVKEFKGVTCKRMVLQQGMKQLDPLVEAAVDDLKKEGKKTDIIELPNAYWFVIYETKITKFPASVYFVVIDWDKAKVSLKLAQCGDKLKTVKQMVEQYNPIAATNGAYFSFVPPKTYYPLKIDGKMYLPGKGYDSREGMAFNEGEMPVIANEKDFDKYENVIMGYHIWSKEKYTLNPNVLSAWTEVAAGDTPLTAVGFNFEKRRVVLMTSDGRFPKDAPGLTFYSEGFFLKLFGCTDVLSIDGGGSCTMLIREKGKLSDPVNHPSDNRKFDHKGARSVQNCIYLIDK